MIFGLTADKHEIEMWYFLVQALGKLALSQRKALYEFRRQEVSIAMTTKPTVLFKKMWHAAPLATVIFVLALLASVVFGARATVFWIKRPPMSERALPVAAWMTPRYIARSWGVPPRVIAEAIKAPIPPRDGPMSLTELAKMRDVPVEQVIAEAEAAIAAVFAERGKPIPEPNEKSEVSE